MMNISLEFFFFSASISSSYNQFILNHNEHKNIDYCHTTSILYIYKGDSIMAQANINIRMDEDLKKQFEAFCSDIGMSMTTAFCVFAKTAVRERRIPFEISAANDPFYSPNNMKRLKKSIAEMEKTGGTIHEVNPDD
ncbi:MAG: type II toxin-antitoxin system RelB/DinJ family antitoxin [Galactobacillus timonensis]|uniref:type II toxin-antitoxin system RelB/DinJ family antitoxin n=1 Tax=Galactobacillus timonensis TaxID=2041840 RepID=UPI0023F06391|nr:type II toxin-antitoxin system RelB/DinJ family antitoxin [Galactobacillus timonensis]MCI6067674.1 type II toxin-antitoxin system RelB/DinJ family antitoxin [Galactobacillus timonensis]MDD6370529.1 type II toxin-antitoxin system RelB/DinJ family antitoxin [Galactobacillus timonensis]MDD6599311.1 type II toxin-antitoxin system RelB/DinJ family antitoxin [Galactobacillus timonensis]